MERVERVEELLLRALLAREELDVVDEEDVDVAVPVLELVRDPGADRLDEIVHEAFRGDVEMRIFACFSITRCPIACMRCVFPSPTPP